MDRRSFEEMSSVQAEHWWFKGKRLAASRLISSLIRGGGALKIIEIGCGTGANLDMLTSFGNVCGMERDAFARERVLAASNGRAEIVDGSLPYDLSRASGHYDLVCMFDVL